jgi:hypothetical protein
MRGNKNFINSGEKVDYSLVEICYLNAFASYTLNIFELNVISLSLLLTVITLAKKGRFSLKNKLTYQKS